jgi:hypothetical protein
MCTEEIIEEEVQPKKVRRPIRIKRKSRMSTQALTLTNGEMPSYIQCMYTGVLDWFNNDSTYDVNTYVDSLPLHTKLYLWFWLKFYNLVTHFTFINSILMFMLGPNWFIERAFGLNKSFLARHILSYGFYRIKHDLTVPKKLLAITLAIGSGYLLYNMLKKTLDMFVGDTQGGIMSTGSTPPPDTDNKPHVIYEDPFRISVDDLSQQTLCAKGKDLSFLKKHVNAATVMFSSKYEGVTRVGTAVNVRGNIYMCNAHVLPNADDFLIDIIDHYGFKINASLKNVRVTPSIMYRDLDHDLVFLKLLCRATSSEVSALHCYPGWG